MIWYVVALGRGDCDDRRIASEREGNGVLTIPGPGGRGTVRQDAGVVT